MSDTERVRAWRTRLKQSGLVPMTIWVSAATRARYEDLALTYRRSPSELASAALEAYRPTAAPVADTVSATEQLHTLIRAELAHLTVDVTATVTDTVTETLMTRLQALVADAVGASDPQAAPGQLVAVPVTATATATEPVTPAPGGDQGSARRAASAPVTAPVTATATETPAARPRGRAPAAPADYDPDVAFARMQALQATGLSLAQIADRLTAEGLPTRHGKPWHKSTVAYVLKTHGR